MFTKINQLINRAIFAGVLFGMMFPAAVLLTVIVMAGFEISSIASTFLVTLGWLSLHLTLFCIISTPGNFIRLRAISSESIRAF